MEQFNAVQHQNTASGNRDSQIKMLSNSTRGEDNHASPNNGVVMAHLDDLHEPSNLWDGFAVEPAHGTWHWMKDLLLSIICSNDPQLFKYLVGWMAAMVQKPDSAGQVALFLNGAGDTGKGMFIRFISDLMGEHVFHVTDLKQVTGRFNSHLKDCVLLVMEGAFSAGNNRVESVLKTLISESSIAIKQKGKDMQIVPNKFHVILSGNDNRVLDIAVRRRLCVLNVSNARQHDNEYFSKIAKEMADGGLSAMLYDLQHFDLGGFDVRDVPRTQG